MTDVETTTTSTMEKTETKTTLANQDGSAAQATTTTTSPAAIVHAVSTSNSSTTSSNSTSGGSSSNTPLMDPVRGFLDSEGITYQAHAPSNESAVVSMNLTGKSGNFRTFVEVRQGQKRVLVYVESPVKVPGMRRSLAAEFLMRVNYSLALGGFELDFRDGEVRYRNGIDVDGGVLSNEMIRQLIMVPAATMDRFFGGLMQVVYGTTMPAEAFEECRNNIPGNPNAPSGSSQ